MLKRGPNNRIWNRHPGCYSPAIEKIFTERYIKEKNEQNEKKNATKTRIQERNIRIRYKKIETRVNRIKKNNEERINNKTNGPSKNIPLENKVSPENMNKEYEPEIETGNKMDKKNDTGISIVTYLNDAVKSAVCPICYQHSIKYESPSGKWACENCRTIVDSTMLEKNIFISDDEKYNIYKLWGVHAICKLTGETTEDIKRFVADHFKKCCDSKGDECLYFNYLNNSVEAKKLKSIYDIFRRAMKQYENLFHEIYTFSQQIEVCKKNVNATKHRRIEHEYKCFKETISKIVEQSENYIVSTANEKLNINQTIRIKDVGGELVGSVLYTDGIEGVVWNEANEGDPTGVFFISRDFFIEINQSFADFKKEIEMINLADKEMEMINLAARDGLSTWDKKALNMIYSESGIFQNELSIKLNIDSRKCSRIVKSLLDKNFIIREKVASNRSLTYRILPKM